MYLRVMLENYKAYLLPFKKVSDTLCNLVEFDPLIIK